MKMIWLLLLAGHNLVNKSHSCSHKHTDTAIWPHIEPHIAVGRMGRLLVLDRLTPIYISAFVRPATCNLVGSQQLRRPLSLSCDFHWLAFRIFEQITLAADTNDIGSREQTRFMPVTG